MDTKRPKGLTFDRQVTKSEISFAFEFLTGSPPPTETDLNSAGHIARTFPNSRIELFRKISNSSEYIAQGQDFLSILIDQVLRRRVFGGFRIPKVNLFCVGAPRCGTTTLSTMLAQNPNVYCSPIKEPNFFSHLWNGIAAEGVPIEMYELFFAGWQGEPILTDCSPLYLRYNRAIDGIFEYNSKAKMIASLRDPVERAISAFFYTMDQHACDDIMKFYGPALQGFSLDVGHSLPWFAPEALLRQSFYHSDLCHLMAKFPNAMVINFAEFGDLNTLNRRVCDYVGVPVCPIDWTTSGGRPINSSKKVGGGNVSLARDALKGFFADEYKVLKVDFGIIFQAL